MDIQKPEEIKNFLLNYSEHIITSLLLLPISILFILHEFSDDAKTYQGVARLTDYFGTFPTNIDLAYETKPIANRMLNYFLYKIGSLFTTFGTPEYEILIKIIALLCVLVICYYFSTKINKRYIFLLSTLAFLTPLNFTLLVPDWWSPLFSLLALSLFLTDKPLNHYLSGIIITIICLLKGPTILLVIPIACMIYFLKRDQWLQILKRGAISSSIFLIIILLCGYFKNIIPDMLILSKYGHLGYDSFSTMVMNFVNILLPTLFFIPILISGFVAALLLYYQFTKNREITKLCMLICMWIPIFIYIFIQNEFFPYHYMSLVLPAILSIILLSNISIKRSIITIIIIFIAMSYLGSIMNVEGGVANRTIANNIITNFPDIQHQDHILYLDSGSAPYYFQSNTSCRFIQSLPFKTNSPTWNITDTPQYQENFKCIMGYNDKYIIIDELWFNQNTSDSAQVINKIQTNYKLVYNDGWRVYERK
jgi:hypothetical protein